MRDVAGGRCGVRDHLAGRERPTSPDWTLGIATGVGGLAGGWLGASVQSGVPERTLRTLLGVLALALAVLYLAQVLG